MAKYFYEFILITHSGKKRSYIVDRESFSRQRDEFYASTFFRSDSDSLEVSVIMPKTDRVEELKEYEKFLKSIVEIKRILWVQNEVTKNNEIVKESVYKVIKCLEVDISLSGSSHTYEEANAYGLYRVEGE